MQREREHSSSSSGEIFLCLKEEEEDSCEGGGGGCCFCIWMFIYRAFAVWWMVWVGLVVVVVVVAPTGRMGMGTRSGEEEEDFHTRFWHQRSLGRKFCPAGVRVQGRGDINCLDNNVHTHALLVRSALRNFGPETNCAFLPPSLLASLLRLALA